MISDQYILDDNGEPKIEPDHLEWGRWFKSTIFSRSRNIAETTVGPFFVSTVFLGVDHNWLKGPPILWETMIFLDDECDGVSNDSGQPISTLFGEYQERYDSREKALEGHERAVQVVSNKLAGAK